MAYNISKTNGNDLVTVADGTTDTNYTSLTLIGKNFAGYGDFLNENFVHLLENFANSTEPPNALEGQVWWDTTNKVLKVRSSTGFKSVSSTTSSTSEPANAIIGDLWWDTANGQLKLASSSSTWTTIGPAYTATQGQTGVIAASVADTAGTPHVIVKFMVHDTLVAVMNKDANFTPVNLPGFTLIKPGMNFSAPMSTNNYNEYRYYGDSYNALNLNNIAADKYFNDEKANVASFPFSIKNDNGLTVGNLGDLKLTASTESVDVFSTKSGKNMLFRVTANDVPMTLLTLSSTKGALALTPDSSSDPARIATKEYVDNAFTGPNATALRRDGSTTITGTLVPNVTNSINFGSSAAAYATIYATNFAGLASDSSKLGGYPVGSFVRSDAPTTMTTPIYTTSNSGLTLGSAGDFSIDVTSSPNSVNLNSNTAGKSLRLSVKLGTTLTPAISIDGVTGLATVISQPVATNGIATKGYVDAIAAGGVSLASINGNIIPNANDTYNIGSDPSLGGKKFRAVYATNFYGNASTANYADLAERFAADAAYLPGTVVELGGDAEVTSVVDDLSETVFGVISSQPAYLMNQGAGDDATHPPIALHGRVPVRVVGTVVKGDRLVSAGNGVARAASKAEITSSNVIGRALENKTTAGEGLVLAVVKANI